MLVFCLVFTSSVQALDVVVGIQDNAPIDIIMAKGKSGFDVGPFKERLTNSLKKYGIDMSRVYIDSAETYSLNVTDQDPSKILSEWSVFQQRAHWFYNPTGRAIVDSMYHCYRSGFYNENAYVGGKITYEAEFTGSDHDYNDYYGLTFCMDGTRNYYAVVWEDIKGSSCGIYSAMCREGLSLLRVADCTCMGGRCNHATLLGFNRIPWTRDATMHNDTHGMGTRFESHHLKIVLDNGLIQVYTDGILRISAYDDTYKGGAYGLVSVSHGGGLFYNIRITGESSKDLVDVVRAPNWRPQSHRFIVDLTDEPREEFDNNFKLGELIERIEIDDAHYLGVGTSLSQDSIRNFIARNEGNGIYLSRNDNTEDELYDKMAEYIAKIVNSRVSGSGDVMLLKDYDYKYNYKFQ